MNFPRDRSAISLLKRGKQDCVRIQSAVEMDHKFGHPLCPTQEMLLYGQAQDWSCMSMLSTFRLSTTSMSGWVPGSCCIPAPLSLGKMVKKESRRSRICGLQSTHVPHNVITAARMSSWRGGSHPFSTPDHCKISFWEDSASHLFLPGLSMLPPINLAKF